MPRPSDEEAVSLLTRMVEIPSVSGDEAGLAGYLVERMAALGFDEAAVDAAGNAVGRMGAGPRQAVLLGHMDTVPGRIPVRLEDGWLHGRGSVDAKGPLAAFVTAAARLGARPGWSVVVVGAVEEEAPSSRGARHAAGCFAPEACVIGEPSGWESLTLGYKGRLLLRYRLLAPLGHSAGPEPAPAEAGAAFWNRVQAAAAGFNQEREALFDRLLPSLLEFRTSDDGLHQTVALTLSFRTPPGFEEQEWMADLERLAGPASLVAAESVPAWEGGRSNALVRAFLPAIRSAGGRPAFKRKTGTSDMNVVGPAWGCPILAYGPGDSRLDHTPEERLDTGEYLRAVTVLHGALAALTSDGGQTAGRPAGSGAGEAAG